MAEPRSVLRADEQRVWEFFLETGPVNDRKLRLLACACCRYAWKWLGRLEQRAVETAERYADGVADDEERLSLVDEAWFVWSRVYGRGMQTVLGLLADHLSVRECVILCRTVLAVRGPRLRGEIEAWLHEEIFGPPAYQWPEIGPTLLAWRGGVVVELARAIDDEGRFAALPILADALEEAGCTDEDLLAHCRQRGRRHLRGCWAVDLVLGRE